MPMEPSLNVTTLIEECERAWRALEAEGALLDVADAANTEFRCKNLRSHFRTEDAWQLALKNAEPTAVGCLLALAVKRRELFRPLGLQVLATPELHGDEYVVLECLRGLIDYDDETVFRAILPFCVRSWAGGWLDFASCPFSRRGEVLIEFFNRDDRADIQWSKIGEPASDPPPAGDWGRCGEMLTDTFVEASPDVRQGLCKAGNRLFQQAATQAMRMQLADALARMGESTPCLELCESSLERLREQGCHVALSYFARDFVERLGGIFTATDERSRLIRQSFDKSRRHLCAPLVDSEGRLIIIYQPRRWEPGNVYGENVICNVSLIWFDPKTGQQRHEVIAPACFETQHSALSSIDGCGASVILVEVRISGQTMRYYVGFDADDRLQIASSKKDIKARLSRPKATRKTAAAKSTPVPPPVPLPSQAAEPSAAQPTPKKPSTRAPFEVTEVGRDRSSSEGKIAVSGHRHLGVVDTASDKLHFAPPRSVAIALGDSSLVSWRIERRDGASGVGRGDYDWIIEVYSFPTEPRFLRGYTIRARDTVAWCWPDSISLPKAQRGRLVAMKARSEDFSATVFVVLHDDGTFSETLDRQVALAVLAGKDADPAQLISHRIEADGLPARYPETALGRAAQRYVAGLKELGFDPLLRSGATPKRLAALAERLGEPLPGEVVALLSIADGEYDLDGSVLGGYGFLSAGRIEKILAEQAGRSPAILPIAKEPLRGNYVGVMANTGAVVAYGMDESTAVELFPSLTGFVEWLAESAASGKLRFVQGGGDAPSYLVHRQGRLPNAILHG